VQAGAGAVAVMVTVKGSPVRAPPAAQPQPSRQPPAPHSDCLCAIGRVVASSGLHDTALGLRAQLKPLAPDPPGICGEEQTIMLGERRRDDAFSLGARRLPRTPPTQPRLCTSPNSPCAKKPAPRTTHEPSRMALSSPC